MNKNTKIKVRNRSTCPVGYTIPDMGNYRRQFAANETKELPFEEVQKVAFIPGGEYLLQHYLVIENIEARDEILGSVELEYSYSEKDIERLLLHGTMDELLDCLDFAPIGVIDLVKSIAVKTELNDIRKREAIFEKTGFNVSNAVAINRETDEAVEKAEPAARRVQSAEKTPSEETQAPVRRTQYALKSAN